MTTPGRCMWNVRCQNDPGNFAYCADHRCYYPNCPTELRQDAFTSWHASYYAPFGQYCQYHTCPVRQCPEMRMERPHKDRTDPNHLDHDHELDFLKHCEIHQCRYGVKGGGRECNSEIEPVLHGTPYCSAHKATGLEGMSQS